MEKIIRTFTYTVNFLLLRLSYSRNNFFCECTHLWVREQKIYKRHGTKLRSQLCESSGRAAGPRIKNSQGFFQGFLLKIYGKQKRRGAFFLSSKHGQRYGFKSVCFIKKAVGGGRLFLWAVGCKGSFKGHCGFSCCGAVCFSAVFTFFAVFFYAKNIVSAHGSKIFFGWG